MLPLLLSSPLLTLAATTTVAPGSDSIPSVVISIENLQPSRGVFLTPPWIGIHDGRFDTYDGGSPASTPLGGDQIERMAEDGNNGPLADAFALQLPNAPQLQGVAGPAGPLGPGDRVAVTLNVDPTVDRYFSYASMVIPSNDTFVANGDPMSHMLFDAAGNFVGQNFIVSGDEANDAGTEINDEIAGNVAFLNQAGPDLGTNENGVVSPSPGFLPPGSLSYPDGVLNYPVFGNGSFHVADARILGLRFRYVDLGGRVRYQASLSPRQEVQAEPVLSSGFGSSQLLSTDAQTLGVFATFEDLTGPVLAAHLHLGQAGTNGPVVADLTGGLIGGDRLRFVVTSSELTGPLDGEELLALINELAAGNVYVNLHTAAYPAGELRGQVRLSR